VCGGGQCLPNCDGFQDQCGDSCTNNNNDPLNCGECGKVCDGDELCVDGECRPFAVAPCGQCPCEACSGDLDRCCVSLFIDAAVCLDAGECP